MATEKTGTVEKLCAEWNLAYVPAGAPDRYVREMRRAFWSGTAACMSTLEVVGDDVEADTRLLEGMAEEISTYFDRLKKGQE